MRRTWPILALAVAAGGVAVLLVGVRGKQPGARQGDPAARAGSPAKAAPEERLPDVAPEATGETVAPELEPLRGDWTIEGRVVRERDGEPEDLDPTPEPLRDPVAGAAVRVRLAPPEKGKETPPPRASHEVTTGPDGRFAVAGLPGTTRLEVEVDASGSALKVIQLALHGGVEGTERRRDLEEIVLRPAFRLIVRLVDPDNTPVEGGKVVISDLDEDKPDPFYESPRDAFERDGGEYVAERLPPGRCSVEVSAADWAPSWESVELPREEPFVVPLGEGVSPSGTVRASTGEPIAGARVIAKGDRTFPDMECETDASGRFQLRNVPSWGGEIEIAAEGFHGTTRSFKEGEDLEIWLVRGAALEGKVMTHEDERPLAGFSVALYFVDGSGGWVEATTDARGEFLARNLLPGVYHADFTGDDYLPLREGPWHLAGGEKVSGVIARLRRGFTARGRVADADTGQPIEHAFVSAVWQETVAGEPDLERNERTDRNGAFELPGLAPGAYRIEVKARGYLRTEISSRLDPEDAGNLDLVMEKGCSISGRALDGAGRPFSGTRIYLDAPLDAPQAVAHAVANSERPFVDARGKYLLDGLPPFGQYSLLADHEDLGYRRVEGIAVEPRAHITGLDIQFPAGGSVRGRVVDETGRGMEGATVNLVPGHEEKAAEPQRTLFQRGPWYAPNRWATTSADGTYEVKNVATGLYEVYASAPGWTSREKDPIRVEEGHAFEGIDFVFTRGAVARGRISDQRGLGIVGARVEIQAGGQDSHAETTSDGRFLVMGLAAGRGDLSAVKEGFGRAAARISLPSDDLLLVLRPLGKIAGRLEAPGTSVFQEGNVHIRNGLEASSPVYDWVPTDEAGRFSASVEPGPSILVTAEIPGFALGEVETALAPGERREVVVPLRRGGEIEGSVVSRASGEPVDSAEVYLEAPGGSRAGMTALTAHTDGEGAFSIDRVPEGIVVIVARHWEYRAARVEGVQVIAGETARARIELEGGQGVHGCVEHHGRPVGGAKVTVLPVAGPGATGSGSTGAATGPGGLYEVPGLAPGEYDVSVEAAGPGGRPLVLRRRVTVEAGQLTERDLDLGTVVVSGRVVRNGAPVADVDIAAASLGEWLEHESITTDASGEYSLELPGGREIDLTLTVEGEIVAEVDIVLPEGPAELRRDIDLGALASPVEDTR